MSEMFGRYRLEELLGRGGMGEVHRAVDTVKGRTVAVKRLPDDIAADDGFQARFRREAALAARLDHPHVVPVYDYGEIDGRLYLEMRLIEGTDVASMLADAGALPPARAVQIITHVATALDAAHDAGLIHRDVKPSNILVAPPARSGTEFAYLADFGIARPADDGARTALTALTSDGGTVGTVAYMAPERLRGEPGDHRVDVYSLACVLFEALTGRRPFTADSLPALVHAHLGVVPPRVTELRPDLPPALDAVLARGLAKNPDDRHPYAGDLANDAAAALGPTDVTQPALPATLVGGGPGPAPWVGGYPHPAGAAGHPLAPPFPPPPGPGPTGPPRRFPWLAVIAVVAVLAVLSTVALLVFTSRDPAGPAVPVAAAPVTKDPPVRIRDFLGPKACEVVTPAQRFELGLGSASTESGEAGEDGHCSWRLVSGGLMSAVIDVSNPAFADGPGLVPLTVDGFRAERYFVDDDSEPQRFCVVRFQPDPEATVAIWGDWHPTTASESETCATTIAFAERVAGRLR